MIKLKDLLNEGLYFVGYNKGRGQGTGVFKDSYSSYKDAKKAVEKLEKERGGSYNQIAYYVADKDGKFVRESVTEATMPPVRKVVNAILKKHGLVPMKTTSTSVRGFHNIQRGGYRYEGDLFLGFYGDITQNDIEKIGDEMKKAGFKEVDVRRGIISADFTKTGLKESVNEAKAPYEVYHKSYTSAIEAAREYAEKKGYEINDDDSFRQIGMGPRKPSEGKTNSFSIQLSKDGKPQRKKLQIQVYGMKNSYELNAYIQ